MKNESGFSLEIASQPFKKEIKKKFQAGGYDGRPH